MEDSTTGLLIISVLLFNFYMGGVCLMIGARKDLTGTGLFLGLILGIFAIPIMILSKGNRKDCPNCSELVSPKATKCPHCASYIMQHRENKDIIFPCEIYKMLYSGNDDNSFLITNKEQKLLLRINEVQLNLIENSNGNKDEYLIDLDVTNITGFDIILKSIKEIDGKILEQEPKYKEKYFKAGDNYSLDRYNNINLLKPITGQYVKNGEMINGKLKLIVNATYLPKINLEIKQI